MLVEPVVVYEYSLCKRYAVVRGNDHGSLLVNSFRVHRLACSLHRRLCCHSLHSDASSRTICLHSPLNQLGLTFDAAWPLFTAMDFVWLWCVFEGLLFPFSSNCTIVYASPYSSVSYLTSLVVYCAPSFPVGSILTLRFEDFDCLS